MPYGQDKEKSRQYNKRYRQSVTGREAHNRGQRKYARSEKGRLLQKRDRLKRRYGLTLTQYEAMLIEQNGCCAICQQKLPLGVDHNHITKQVRGLLCDWCNKAIGFLMDNLGRARQLVLYLEHHDQH